jgi:hypothetical protein
MNRERQFRQHRRTALATLASIGALAPLFAASPALAQEERSVAPSLPDSGGDEPRRRA